MIMPDLDGCTIFYLRLQTHTKMLSDVIILQYVHADKSMNLSYKEQTHATIKTFGEMT